MSMAIFLTRPLVEKGGIGLGNKKHGGGFMCGLKGAMERHESDWVIKDERVGTIIRHSFVIDSCGNGELHVTHTARTVTEDVAVCQVHLGNEVSYKVSGPGSEHANMATFLSLARQEPSIPSGIVNDLERQLRLDGKLSSSSGNTPFFPFVLDFSVLMPGIFAILIRSEFTQLLSQPAFLARIQAIKGSVIFILPKEDGSGIEVLDRTSRPVQAPVSAPSRPTFFQDVGSREEMLSRLRDISLLLEALEVFGFDRSFTFQNNVYLVIPHENGLDANLEEVKIGKQKS